MFKTKEKLRILPPGSVTARGWIREQLLRSKNGMGGHLDELEPEMIATPYITNKSHDQWGTAIKAGWGAEISGNYWYGLIQLAFALDDGELKAKACRWVEGALANQRENGYLGTYTENDNMADDYNAWGTSCGLSALQAYYEATKAPEVLEAIRRCLIWFCENWAGDRKTKYAGQMIVFNMAWCYRLTGDERLVKFIDEYFDYLNRNDLYLNSVNAMRSPDLIYNSFHAGGVAILPKIAAAGYMARMKDEYLEAAVNIVEKVKEKILLPTGGISSNSEYISPIESNTETEYCAYAFFQNSLIWLAAVTGDPQYYDVSERIALNGAQGARKKDEKAIAYFTSGNQIYSTMNTGSVGGSHGAYAPCHPVSCCPVTSVWIMPDYLYGMALTDCDGGVYISEYGPARLNSDGLILETDTLYPFRDTVEYRVGGDTEKKVYFRIPAWCDDFSVTVNGEEISGDNKPGAWFKVARVWKDGDIIRVRLPMRVTIGKLNDKDSWRHYPLVIEYGPLVFSLPLPEVWTPIHGDPRTPLPEGWSWYNLTPRLDWDERGDVYEQQGWRKYNISWNVAIDEKIDPDLIKVEEHEGGYVWENPPLTLTLPGYKALYSYAPYIQRTYEVYQSPIDVQGELNLKLAPYGCTGLRISYFPRANVNI